MATVLLSFCEHLVDVLQENTIWKFIFDVGHYFCLYSAEFWIVCTWQITSEQFVDKHEVA